MEELLVPLEIATILKAKGFNEPVPARFFKGKYNRNTLGRWYSHNSGEISKDYIAAPIYDQVITWLELKEIFVVPELNIEFGSFEWYGRIYRIIDSKLEICYHGNPHPIKRKCLNDAIKEALKLV